ncbi:MAG: hypothetical protein R3C11_21750 [Planctomycetaceae bacterium]
MFQIPAADAVGLILPESTELMLADVELWMIAGLLNLSYYPGFSGKTKLILPAHQFR